MKNTIIDKEITFLVPSCDKYSDLWQPLFTSLFRHWKNISFDVVLVSNYQKYDDRRVRTIQLGEDEAYADNLRKALTKIDTEWVILWLDDVFLSRPVDEEKIQKILDEVADLDVDFVKLSNDMPISYSKRNGAFIGELPEGIKYRSGIGLTLARKRTLFELAQPGLNAWEMDRINPGTVTNARFSALTNYGRKNSPFGYIHAVVKGRWIYNAPRKLRNEGFEHILPGRERQSFLAFSYILLYQAYLSLYRIFNVYWK